MKSVGIRELKSNLSRYLRAVKQGETVLVTERGQVIAEIGQVSGSRYTGDKGSIDLRRLARLVTISHIASNDPAVYPTTAVRTSEGTARRLIAQERGD